MKILKKKIKYESLGMIDGQPAIMEHSKDCYFAMTLKAHRKIEQELKTPLMKLLSKSADGDFSLVSADVASTILSACYFTTENGAIHQDDVTFTEFVESGACEAISDVDTLTQVTELIVDYFGLNEKAKTFESTGKSKRKN